jgi:dynein heavy chain 1
MDTFTTLISSCHTNFTGIFTSILRTILANQRGEADRRHWIVFDGDVDPEWAENLNR